MPTDRSLRLAVDIGGTFTDAVLMDGQHRVLATAKTATTHDDRARSALAGAEAVLCDAGATWSEVGGMVHGTTLATNALIERRGAAVASVTTAGFRDILEIGYERRYSQYAINLEKPDLIVGRRHAFTIAGRMDARGHERTPLDRNGVAGLIQSLREAEIEAVAICLLHAYANPAHELALRDLLHAAMPDLKVSLSHEVSPEAREFERLCTTIANAYIQPLMAGYLARFEACFAAAGLSCPILMMTAGGGMTTIETAARLPIRLVESGPAGGAILAARIAAQLGEHDVLSFDMGGTTAKLCLVDAARPQMSRSFEIARAERFIKGSGMPVRIPVIEMIEIGAGGGSLASVDPLGRLRVGPKSAGSDPGPVAFSKGGDVPTVTDADLVLGLISPIEFAEGRLKLDPDAAKSALLQHVGAYLSHDAVQSALGVSEIVDESMEAAGRMHAVESGKDLSQRLMIAFGGNGPLHATRVARRAQVSRILVPRAPGVGSAMGFLFAPVSFEIVRSHYTTVNSFDIDAVNRIFREMRAEAEPILRAGAPGQTIKERRIAFMRYKGQGHEIEIELPPRAIKIDDMDAITQAFDKEYARQFSRPVPDMTIEIMNWALYLSTPSKPPEARPDRSPARPVTATAFRPIYCDISASWTDAAVFQRAELQAGDQIAGPALIVEPQTTTFVSADFKAGIDSVGNIWMTRNAEIAA
ncbi:MAG: hydantoinase/oxoprolinase family protein [Pseudomonadota bacterium]